MGNPLVSFDRRELIATIPAFAALPMPVRNATARLLQSKIFAEGETVVREGEPGDRLFIIVKGRAEVRRCNRGTTRRRSHRLHQASFSVRPASSTAAHATPRSSPNQRPRPKGRGMTRKRVLDSPQAAGKQAGKLGEAKANRALVRSTRSELATPASTASVWGVAPSGAAGGGGRREPPKIESCELLVLERHDLRRAMKADATLRGDMLTLLRRHDPQAGLIKGRQHQASLLRKGKRLLDTLLRR